MTYLSYNKDKLLAYPVSRVSMQELWGDKQAVFTM